MKIAIIGMGDGWDTPKKKDHDELWGVSPLIVRRNDLDLLFQMHNLDWSAADDMYLELKGDREAFWDTISIVNDEKIPIVLQGEHELFPHATVFPLDEMPVMYFTSTFAYMIAYALYKGATEINIYGIPLCLEGEYREQRSCVEFWIGYAAGQGVQINVHGQTILLSAIPYSGLYGYDY